MKDELGFELKTIGKKIVEETAWGVYVWQTPDGEILGDDDGNFMLIRSVKGDREKIQKLADAAKHYGYPEGKAVFWSGKRPITDEELEEQLQRAAAGLVPDPLDIGAIRDEARSLGL